MKWDAWALSARLAWRQPWLRWSALLTFAVLTVGVTFFFWKMVPLERRTETVVLHYNLYLGIDDVRAWSWIFVLPAVWVVMVLADLAFAYGLYRADPQFALSLSALAFLWSLAWAGGLYYLTLVNT